MGRQRNRRVYISDSVDHHFEGWSPAQLKVEVIGFKALSNLGRYYAAADPKVTGLKLYTPISWLFANSPSISNSQDMCP